MESMNEEYLGMLEAYFREKRSKNPHYSLRALARDLKVPVSTLSGILNRKHRPSVETRTKILMKVRGIYIGKLQEKLKPEEPRKLVNKKWQMLLDEKQTALYSVFIEEILYLVHQYFEKNSDEKSLNLVEGSFQLSGYESS